jgi:hypothetical protein
MYSAIVKAKYGKNGNHYLRVTYQQLDLAGRPMKARSVNIGWDYSRKDGFQQAYAAFNTAWEEDEKKHRVTAPHYYVTNHPTDSDAWIVTYDLVY